MFLLSLVVLLQNKINLVLSFMVNKYFNNVDVDILQGRVELRNGSHLLFTSVLTGDGGNYTCKMNLIDGHGNVYEQSSLLKVLGKYRPYI